MSDQRSIACSASLMVAMVLIMMINTTEAQDNTSCASNLVPCADYLNSTKPPSSCCDPLKKTVETQLTCLCNLFYSPGLLQTLNVNKTQALELAGKCGISGGLSSCKQASGSAPAPTSGGSPPAKSGGESGDKGGAGRVSFTGFSFVLLLASMMFN
ncbi:non-specific lipid transfer protein GPI-anchored 7-like [Vicia villosa]|uniref:non-specific lipid transfer protein GPI-anchored 7-like n=1 Tax=Vicia villosa TaxID=3911 RepID=UPI00273B0ABC|nr:non-specific lipid transfer protein GPI-anchored 7-like [Vicia villosa]